MSGVTFHLLPLAGWRVVIGNTQMLGPEVL